MSLLQPHLNAAWRRVHPRSEPGEASKQSRIVLSPQLRPLELNSRQRQLAHLFSALAGKWIAARCSAKVGSRHRSCGCGARRCRIYFTPSRLSQRMASCWCGVFPRRPTGRSPVHDRNSAQPGFSALARPRSHLARMRGVALDRPRQTRPACLGCTAGSHIGWV